MPNRKQEKLFIVCTTNKSARTFDCSTSVLGAGNAAASPGKKILAMLVRFGQIWLDSGKIRAKLRRNLGKSD